MIKITIGINKHSGERISRLDSEDESDRQDGHEPKPEKKDPDLAIPDNIEKGEDRLTVTRTNWLGRRERSSPKKRRSVGRTGEK